MNNTGEKLNKFSLTVMKEAEKRQKEMIAQAEQTRRETLDSNETRLLKQAYETIQDTVHKLEKEINEEVSRAIIESKRTLFTRREQIIDATFGHVKDKLLDFKKQDDYKTYMEGLIRSGLAQVGQGELIVLADSDDIPLIEQIRSSGGLDFQVSESESELLGGCVIMNRTKGFLSDYSFSSRLKEERSDFLEHYGIGID